MAGVLRDWRARTGDWRERGLRYIKGLGLWGRRAHAGVPGGCEDLAEIMGLRLGDGGQVMGTQIKVGELERCKGIRGLVG